MIRTRRASVVDDLDLPPRRPRHPAVKLTKGEADLYERTTQFLRRLYREGFVQHEDDEGEAEDGSPRRRTGKGMVQLAMIHLRQRLCSSAKALAESLAHLAEGERIKPAHRTIARQLAERARKVTTHAKLNVLTKILKETPDRVVVFSDHRPTIELIEQRVKTLGRTPIVYWGALTTPERDKRIRAFHDDARSVLIATRAGSEGRNLQICNVLVNYDLPWNPMVIEQRIGRVHRIGQTREVHIVNLAAAGTIESYILQLLDKTIKLFERRFDELSLPARLRLGLGTSHLVKAAGWEAKRRRLGVQVTELLEALESIEPIGGVATMQPPPAGSHPEYGALVRLTGLTSSGRAITLVAQVERLPLALVDISVEAA